MFDIQYENKLLKIIKDMEIMGYKTFVCGADSIENVIVALPIEVEDFASPSEREDLILLIKNETVKNAKEEKSSVLERLNENKNKMAQQEPKNKKDKTKNLDNQL